MNCIPANMRRCRSPCGERGLKLLHGVLLFRACGRSPCGERGLKSWSWLSLPVVVSSLPVRGAWIEMPFRRLVRPPRGGRSPCGERGLKCGGACASPSVVSSLPVRGAWIEIASRPSVSLRYRRSPCGERGLKSFRGRFRPFATCRSPCGERGLKLLAAGVLCWRLAAVAPRAGSVD